MEGMKKLLIFFGMLTVTTFMSPSVKADISTKQSSSIQLTVNAAATQVGRIGSTYSVSGSGVTMDVGGGNSADGNVGGLGTLSNAVAPGSIATATQTTTGGAYSFTQNFTAGDALVTTAPTTGAVSALSSQTSTAAGSTAPTGTILTTGAMTVVGGGAGTSATGQFVSEITIYQ